MHTHLRLFCAKPGFPGRNLFRFYNERLAFLEDLASSNSPIVTFNVAGDRLFLVNEPDLIKDILVTNHSLFKKGFGLQRAKVILGEGLLTSEGEIHRRQRRIIQPVFQHKHLQSYAEVMIEEAEKVEASWESEINLSQEMMRLTLLIVGKSLFRADLDAKTDQITALVTGMMEAFLYIASPFYALFRVAGNKKVKAAVQAREELDRLLTEMIANRRNLAVQRPDLFSLLFSAQDSESGERMSDQQLRDEAMTLFLAGHETTANGLCWTLFLLARHPGLQTRVRSELETVLQGQKPTVAHLDRLVFLGKVIRESLRLYPPAYIIGRRSIQDHSLAGIKIPAGSILFFSPWTTQRSSRFYKNPLAFDPERWTPQFLAALPRFAYFPFGGGPRQCIGEGFAWMEMSLVLAFLIQKWRFELIPGQSIKPKPAMTLRSNQSIYMRLSTPAQRSREEN